MNECMQIGSALDLTNKHASLLALSCISTCICKYCMRMRAGSHHTSLPSAPLFRCLRLGRRHAELWRDQCSYNAAGASRIDQADL